MYTNTHAHTHIYIYTHIYIHTRTHTYTRTLYEIGIYTDTQRKKEHRQSYNHNNGRAITHPMGAGGGFMKRFGSWLTR